MVWLALLTWLLGCTDGGGPVVVDDSGASVLLRLVNPTDVDPMSGVQTLRLELVAGGEVVVQQEFGIDEQVSVPGLSRFGPVRFRLAGLIAGQVVSYGRSPEVVIAPGIDREVYLTFLPVGELLPVVSPLSEPRSRHLAVRLPDGRVLLAGGADPGGDAFYDDLEAYLPDQGVFAPLGGALPAPVAEPSTAWSQDLDLAVIGGTGLAGPSELPRADASLFHPASGVVETIPDMATPRSSHCFGFVREQYGVAIGGTQATDQVETLRPNQDSGLWEWVAFEVDGLAASGVRGCAMLSGGRIFLQGGSAASTGVFDYSDDTSAPGIVQAFSAIDPANAGGDYLRYVDRAMLVPLPGGDVWVGSGIDLETGVALATGREFRTDELAFVDGVDPAVTRVGGSWDAWIEDGWYVLGCGSSDGSSAHPQTEIELVELDGGDRYPSVVSDRSRPGCRVTVLPDGAVLVTGGYQDGDEGAAGAAIWVPYDG